MNEKGRLYLIGGSARTGKTIALHELIKRKPMLAYSTDAIREGLRNVFVGESYLDIQKLSIEGEVVFRRAREKEILTKKISLRPSEDEMTWQAVLGIINYYDRKNISVAIEGLAITPQRVKNLKLQNLKARAIFLGFTKDEHIEKILSHSKTYGDWIQKVIEDEGGDHKIKQWFTTTLEKNRQLATETKKCGYEFFDVSVGSFTKTIDAVVAHLLQ